MFVLATLVFPCVLALLCIGAGLLVDRASAGFLPGMLLPAVGAAALVGLSQLTTYSVFAAPATPYLLALLAVAGFVLGRRRLTALAGVWRQSRWRLAVPVLAYVGALAPVLFAGRPSFSSYGILTDSAFHMLGADFLISHGQDYSHLDLANSYGQYLNAYYNTSYPSGADTLFGGSAFLTHVPLIWAFQPFNAFMLALASGPAWVLVRRIGLDNWWAALATLSVTLPALVYGYELIASVKEITALAMILTLGALVARHPQWLRGPARGGIPFALVSAAGVSALGVAFGAWVLTAVIVLAGIAIRAVAEGRWSARPALLLVLAAAGVGFLAALGTWLDVSGSLRVAKNIAATSNPGNLQHPLRAIQILGTWLVSSYKHVPAGGHLTLSYVLAYLALAAAVLGGGYLLYLRAYALGAWIALTLCVWIGLSAYGTTWANGKALVLTSPVVMLLAWSGIAALRSLARSHPAFGRGLLGMALLLSLAIAGGAGASDAMQYHGSNLAPTARYEELASLDSRFAGRGPVLFTAYDEYSLYLLRKVDVGGPGFMFPSRAIVQREGRSADLGEVSPSALRSYPLLITRRDPSTERPGAAYRLLWQGIYYEVWARRPGASAALAHLSFSQHPAGGAALQCSRIGELAVLAAAHRALLVSAMAPELVRIDVAHASHPVWSQTRLGLLMSRAGRLEDTFTLPHPGVWNLWLQGEIMPAIGVSVDGRRLGTISGQLTGVATDPNTMTPLPVSLVAGDHRLAISRGASSQFAPGSGGSAILDSVYLTPAGPGEDPQPRVTAPARWHSLCGRRLEWVEVVPS